MPVIKNKPVGGHEVELLLQCGHMNREAIEAVIFVPLVNEKRTCQVCQAETTILKVGTPYWVDQEQA